MQECQIWRLRWRWQSVNYGVQREYDARWNVREYAAVVKKRKTKHSEQNLLTCVTVYLRPRKHTMKRTGVERATQDHHHRHAMTIWLATFSFHVLQEDVCESGNVRTSKLLGCLLPSARRCSRAGARVRRCFESRDAVRATRRWRSGKNWRMVQQLGLNILQRNSDGHVVCVMLFFCLMRSQWIGEW